MCHVIKITQAEHAGSVVIRFDEEGAARLVTERISAGGDSRTTAEYLGKANTLPVYFAAANFENSGQVNPPSLRRQAIEHYERAMPHRIAFDVLALERINAEERVPAEYSCVVLGGFRSAKEA